MITAVFFGLVAILVVSELTFSAPGELLAAPRWISVNEDRGGITLRWFRVQDAVEYLVERKEGEKGEFKDIAKVSNPAFDDLNVKPGNFYFYRIVPVGREGTKGSASETRYFQIQPPEPQLLVPPDWLAHIPDNDGISLSWSHPSSKQVLAYNLYRKDKEESTFHLLTSTLSSNFRDRSAKTGLTYEYVLTALDRQLQESDFSHVLTVTNTRTVAAKIGDERFSRINTLEEVVQLSELITEYSWEDYGFISPTDLAYLPFEGLLYVSDAATGYVTVIGSEGQVVRRVGGRGSGPSEFERLLGITVDNHGYVYAVDAYKGEIVVFTNQGVFSGRIRLGPEVQKYFGGSFLERYPWFRFGVVDIAATADGGLLVVDNPNGWIYRLDAAYRLISVIGERGFEPGRMQFPTFSFIDKKGRILVSDTLNSRIQIFEPDGKFAAVIGERGLGIGQFLRPKGIAGDDSGRVFVADSQQNVIQVFDAGGEFISLLGDERGLPLDLGSPNGIVFVEPDLILICEKLSRRIQVRRVLDIFAAETVQEPEPIKKGVSEKRILAPVVIPPQSR